VARISCVSAAPAACRVGSEGLKQRGRQPIRRGVRGGSPALQCASFRSVGVRTSSEIVRPSSCAGPTFQSCPYGTALSSGLAAVLGNSWTLAAYYKVRRLKLRARFSC
jgi:hypothetical protein